MAVPGFLTDLNIVSIILFIALAAYVMWRDRANIERHSVVFVRRTKRGINFLNEVAHLNPKIWRIWSTAGIVVGFLAMAGILYLITKQTLKLFLVSSAVPPVQPVLPTASTFTNPAQAGYFGIPFWHFMVGISVVMVVHELMHGVIARVEDFEVEYVGLILLAIIPGAFVQPKGQKDFFEDDEDESEEKQSPWDQGNWVSRLRVLGAGPWANITLAALLLGLIVGAGAVSSNYLGPNGYYEHQGMKITQVVNGTPAAESGLQNGMIITAIGGNNTTTYSEFNTAANALKPDTPTDIRTKRNGTFTVHTGSRQQNYTFEPAMIDYVLPVLEKQYPGAISTYEAHNDWIVGKCPGQAMGGGECTVTEERLELARWQWVKQQYPALSDTADQRIAELKPQVQEKADGYVGIMVQPETTYKQGIKPFVGPTMLLLSLLYIVTILNFAIGTANLLPVKGLDGGWMLSILVERFAPEKEPRITGIVTLFTIGMIAISFAFLILKFVL